MHVTPFLALLIFLIGIDSYAQVWNVMKVGNGIKPSLAIDQDDIPHIAYMSEAITGYVRHARLNGNAFDTTTVYTGYFYGPLHIDIDPGNQPHIVYHNHNDEDLNHAYLSSGAWTNERVMDTGHDGWDGDMYITPDNRVHVSAVDPSGFGGIGIEYAVKTDTWTVESIGSLQLMYANGTGMAVEGGGIPTITYFDDTNFDLKYATKATGTWVITTIDSVGDVGRFSDQLIDPSGLHHIAYYEDHGDGTGKVKYAFKQNDQWQMSVIDNLGNVELGHFGARHIVSIQYFEAEDRIAVSYGDKDVVKYAVKNGTTWESQTVVDETGTSIILGQQTSLGIDSKGVPHITYFEVNNNGGTVKYAVIDTTVTSLDHHRVHVNPRLTLYPNPGHDLLTLRLAPDLQGNIDISIINLKGQKVKHWYRRYSGRELQLNVTDLDNGFYILQVDDRRHTIRTRLYID